MIYLSMCLTDPSLEMVNEFAFFILMCCRYWWFASTAIPLLAATIGPLANVLSIAAIVSKWRVTLPNEGQLPEGTDSAGVDIPDPKWYVDCTSCFQI